MFYSSFLIIAFSIGLASINSCATSHRFNKSSTENSELKICRDNEKTLQENYDLLSQEIAYKDQKLKELGLLDGAGKKYNKGINPLISPQGAESWLK